MVNVSNISPNLNVLWQGELLIKTIKYVLVILLKDSLKKSSKYNRQRKSQVSAKSGVINDILIYMEKTKQD